MNKFAIDTLYKINTDIILDTDTLDAGLINVLNLVVGDNVAMGSNVVITWDNLSDESRTNLKGTDGGSTPLVIILTFM